MAVELEGLEFQIEAKSEEGTKGVDALTASLGKLKKATKGGLGLNSKVKELNKLNEALKGFHSDKLESLGKALESLNVGGKATISPTIPKRLNEIGQALDNITLGDIERLEDLGKALRELKEVGDVKIPKVKVPSTGVAPTMNTPAGEASAEAATSSVEQATSSVQETAQAITQVTQKTGILKSILNGIGGVFTKGFSVGTGALHKLGNALTKVKMAGAKARTALGKLKDTLGSALAAKVKQNTSGLGKLFSSMKRIAMYRAIRFMFSQLTQAMKEGINNLYRYSTLMGGTFAQSMDRLATSGQYLKNSLGAMAAPIINALAPAIDFVIDKIVTLLNFINMLFARLSGASSFTAAKKNATSYGDSLEKAGGSAAKAAKEIRDATTGIDELNIIMQKDDAGSGGGGGGGTDYGSMFEELPIDNSVSDFADKLKQAFDNANWRELGTLIGGKVNEVIDSINWEGVGHKIGYWINAAVQTAYWFLKTVDFHNLGEHVAEMLNGALEEVDTSFIGRIIVRWFTAKFDFILGALGGLDWGLIARKVSDCIKGAFDEATEWLNGYDWSQMGKDLWANIKEVVTNIDWGGIAESIFTFLGTAIRSAVQFLGGFFGSIGADIKNWWDTEIAGQDWKETAGNLLSAIGEGFLNIGNWVYEHIIDPFCTALLGENVWADVKQAGSDMWAGFTKGITDFFNDPGGWIKTNIVDPFVSWIKNLFGIHSPSTVMAEIGGYIIEGLLNGILAPFKNIGNWVKKHIVDPLVEAVKNSPVISFVVDVVNNAGTWWKNVKEWWKNVSANGVSLSAFVGLLKSGWTTVKDWIGSIPVISQAVSLVKSGWNTVKKWVGELPTLEQAIRLVKSGWETVATWIGNLPVIKQAVSLLKSGWTTVRNWIGNLPTISQTISLLKSGWTTVKSWIGTLPVISQGISLLKSGWTTVKNWIGHIPILSQGINLIKSGWTTVKNWIGTLPVISQGISLLKYGWTTVKNWIGSLPVISQSINLIKSGWTTVKNWIGYIPTISQAISLIKSGWTTVKNWIGYIPVLSQGISLLKSGWTTVKSWIGNIPVLSQAISLIKSGWSTVKNWIGTLPIISQGISLLKSGWTSVKNWIGTSTVSVGISLFKSGWSSLSNFVGNTVSVGISLFKSGWSSIKSFFGLSSGGYNSGHGWKFFEKGGFIDNGQAGFWDSIPKYANGTANAHGSMFVAGEAGPEVVGHVNGRSEVLNKSQLGQVMHRSIVDGMTQFAGYWKSINTHMTTCSNAIISAVLVSADTLYENTKPHDGYDIQDMNEWIDKVASRVSLEVKGAGTTTQFTDGVRDGVAEATARQNQLLKEQNELLQRLVGKETVVQIGNHVIKEAVVTQEKADGYRFTK